MLPFVYIELPGNIQTQAKAVFVINEDADAILTSLLPLDGGNDFHFVLEASACA
jgi:hypothetical protein